MENSKTDKLINSNNLPLVIALIALISTLIATQLNISANRELEEKRLEANLISSAINTDDPLKTKRNISFLLKTGLISEKRQKILANISDSLSTEVSTNFLTKSDSCVFYDFRVTAMDKELFQGNSLITFYGKDELTNLKFQSFTDNTGLVELSFPSFFEGKTFLITIEKNGYKTVSYEYTFPPDTREKAIIPRKEIILSK